MFYNIPSKYTAIFGAVLYIVVILSTELKGQCYVISRVNAGTLLASY